MSKILIVGIVIILIVVGGYIFSMKNSGLPTDTKNPTPTLEQLNQQKIKASFAIFTNSTARVFTDPKYHNQSEDVYMEKANIVIVKKKGATWDDFFKTLPMKLTKECLTTGTGQVFCTKDSQVMNFYVNGKADSNALDREIMQGDKLLVSYGNKSQKEIQKEIGQIPVAN